MKQKLLPKSFFLIAALVSLTAFLYVNIQADRSGRVENQPQVLIQQAAENQDEEEKDLKLAVPDLTIVERVVKFAAHLFPVGK